MIKELIPEDSGAYGEGDTGPYDAIAAHLLDTKQYEAYGEYLRQKAIREGEVAHEPGAELRADRDEDAADFRP